MIHWCRLLFIPVALSTYLVTAHVLIYFPFESVHYFYYRHHYDPYVEIGMTRLMTANAARKDSEDCYSEFRARAGAIFQA